MSTPVSLRTLAPTLVARSVYFWSCSNVLISRAAIAESYASRVTRRKHGDSHKHFKLRMNFDVRGISAGVRTQPGCGAYRAWFHQPASVMGWMGDHLLNANVSSPTNRPTISWEERPCRLTLRPTASKTSRFPCTRIRATFQGRSYGSCCGMPPMSLLFSILEAFRRKHERRA